MVMIFIYFCIAIIAVAVFAMAIRQQSEALEKWIGEGERWLGKEKHGSNTNTKG